MYTVYNSRQKFDRFVEDLEQVRNFDCPIISDYALELAADFLRCRGVTGSISDISSILGVWDLSGSPGMLLTEKFSNKQEYLNDLLDLIPEAIGVFWKAEILKVEKFLRGDQRVIYNVDFPTNILCKLYCYYFDKRLEECGLMFKGEDLRTSLRFVYRNLVHGNRGYHIYNTDVSKMDRRTCWYINKTVWKLRCMLGEVLPLDILEYLFLSPVFIPGEGSYPRCGPLPSGFSSTPEWEFLIQLILWADYFERNVKSFDFGRTINVCFNDLILKGCGDDLLSKVPQSWNTTQDSIVAQWQRFNFGLKINRVDKMEDFDVMGAQVTYDPIDGYQPYFSVTKILIRCCYIDGEFTPLQIVDRFSQMLAYVYYAPDYHLMIEFGFKLLERFPQYSHILARGIIDAPAKYCRSQRCFDVVDSLILRFPCYYKQLTQLSLLL